MNCQDRGRVSFRDLQYVNLDPKTLVGYRLVDGDLLFNRTNSYELVGRTALFRGEREAVFASYLVRLKVDRRQVDPDFLTYYLNWSATQRRLKGFASRGVSQSNISASKLRDLDVRLPPMPEQRAIGAVLSKIQEAIDVQTSLATTLKELKGATMATLFREGLRGALLKQTDIGEFPESWNACALAEISSLYSGGTPPKDASEHWTGPVPWLTPKDMKRRFLRDTIDHITPEAADSFSRVAPRDSVFVVIRGMILAKQFPVAINSVPMAFNQDMKAIAPGTQVVPKFLLYALVNAKDRIQSEIGSSAHGTKRISSSSIERLVIPLPSLDEQRSIADVLYRIDVAEEMANSRLEVLQELFTAVLEGFLSGDLCSEPSTR
jgi:type I restriction enzyme S subunit